MYLNEPLDNLITYLKSLKKLRKLKLSKVKADDVHRLLELMGSQIFHLELVCLRESLDLTQIAISCPNLQNLEIYYSMAVHVSSPLNFQFPKLQKFIIYCTEIHRVDSQAVSLITSQTSIYETLVYDRIHFFLDSAESQS